MPPVPPRIVPRHQERELSICLQVVSTGPKGRHYDGRWVRIASIRAVSSEAPAGYCRVFFCDGGEWEVLGREAELLARLGWIDVEAGDDGAG